MNQEYYKLLSQQQLKNERLHMIKRIEDVCDEHDKALAEIYRKYRTGEGREWYEARVAYDLAAQLRYELTILMTDLKVKTKEKEPPQQLDIRTRQKVAGVSND